MTTNPLLRPLGIASSIIAACQGLTWCVLALLGIVIYAEAWTPENMTTTSTSYFIFFLFLTDFVEDIIMKSSNLIIIISIYFALSFIWMVLSLTKFWVVYRCKWEYAQGTLTAWGLCTAVICVLDVITMSLFASDLQTVLVYYHESEVDWPYQTVAAAAIMMTLAARGFVLLISNIVFAFLFVLWGLTFERTESATNSANKEFINGYEQQRPPTWLDNGNPANSNSGNAMPLGRGQPNPDYGRQYSNQGFEPDFQQRPTSLERNRYVPVAQPVQPPRQPAQPDYGRFGRGNPRPPQNPQSNVPQQRGPYIPDPDYSPTSLRKYPKSVLKSRNHY